MKRKLTFLCIMFVAISCIDKETIWEKEKLLTGEKGYAYWREKEDNNGYKAIRLYADILYYFDDKGHCIEFYPHTDTNQMGIVDTIFRIVEPILCIYYYGYHDYKFVNDSIIKLNIFGDCYRYRILKLTKDTFIYQNFRTKNPNITNLKTNNICLINVPDSLLPETMRKYQRDEELEKTWILKSREIYKQQYGKDW